MKFSFTSEERKELDIIKLRHSTLNKIKRELERFYEVFFYI